MSACPVCGESVTDVRPNYMVVLETSDVARSAAQRIEDDTLEQYALERQLCIDCWEGLYDELTDADAT